MVTHTGTGPDAEMITQCLDVGILQGNSSPDTVPIQHQNLINFGIFADDRYGHVIGVERRDPWFTLTLWPFRGQQVIRGQ